MEGKQCIQKAKTNPAKKSTAPVFQQHLIFNESPKYKMLQVCFRLFFEKQMSMI